MSLLDKIESLEISREKPPSVVLARVLYLFLCENQAEVDIYLNTFPTVTADILLYCWREKCSYPTTHPQLKLFVSPWTSGPEKIIRTKTGQQTRFTRKTSVIIRATPLFDLYPITARVFVINELELNLTKKSTWTTARNLMLERAKREEHEQQWKWAYLNFGDGDVHFSCPLAQQLLSDTSKITEVSDELLISYRFLWLMNLLKTTTVASTETPCVVLFDTFLLTVAPAIGYVSGALIPILSPGVKAQVVYQIDAMFNAFHHDAIDLLLPYCTRFDQQSWWTSQAILVYRSLCVYGHVIQFNAVNVTQQKHRNYPKEGDPWQLILDVMKSENLNLFPTSLEHIFAFMNITRIVNALILHHYSGWDLSLTADDCQKHNAMNTTTCAVYHQPLL